MSGHIEDAIRLFALAVDHGDGFALDSLAGLAKFNDRHPWFGLNDDGSLASFLG